MMFSLDKFKLYDKALANAASLAQYSRSWDKRHAVTDQLLRASERVVLNLAESAAVRVGTYLELCARTDKLDPEEKDCAMVLLDRIASMLRGLGSG